MALSGVTIRAALAAVGAIGKQIRSFDELAAGADGALRQAPPGLTASGAAGFLATLTQESAYLRATEEYGTNLRYDPYRGRTFEMLTWSSNYAAFGKWCKARGMIADANQFVNNPKSLADYRWAWHGGTFFFEANGLWKYANAGRFLELSQGINGGNGRIGTKFVPNGWAHRQAMYRAFLALGDSLLPSGSTSSPAPSAPPSPTRTREGSEMYFQTPQPAAGQPKWEWPTVRIPFAFEPGGKGLLKVDHGGRGGWVHLARWWLRDGNWTANTPRHSPRDHSLGSSQGKAGSERFVGYGWVTPPPDGRADMIELVLSAPDGVHIQFWRTD